LVKVLPFEIRASSSSWKWPEIPGLSSFKGGLLHTANWQEDYSARGKRVAAIGSGSSAIQVVPQLQPGAFPYILNNLRCVKLISFNRSAAWITPEFGEDMAPGGQGREAFYSQDERSRLQDPTYLLDYRKWIENAMNATYYIFRKDSIAQKKAVETFTVLMKERLKNEERLCKSLIPTYGVGCRRFAISAFELNSVRFTPGHGYLEALVADNAEVVTEDIEKITAGGLVTRDGQLYEVDTIICATGFNTSFIPNFQLIGKSFLSHHLTTGRQGNDLRDVWKNEPQSYPSIAASGFPNYFSTPPCSI
jgi:cation diffusion facilitator CzcD-associated flavoprotein CzcO